MECAKSELRGKVTKIALKAGNLISHSLTHFIPLRTPREKRILPLFARDPCVSQWRNVLKRPYGMSKVAGSNLVGREAFFAFKQMFH